MASIIRDVPASTPNRIITEKFSIDHHRIDAAGPNGHDAEALAGAK